MIIPRRILLKKGLDEYLIQRKLEKQYKKAKELFLQGYIAQIDLRIRQPKSNQIYYFKINKQFRACGYYDGDTFFVFHIDNHQ